MEKQTTNLETPSSLLFNHNHNTVSGVKRDENSPTKNLGSGDRIKRDEWSEGAVATLLEAYENKWVLRNRAKLKGHDWEDVARHVSCRANSSKSSKTQTQCKNKIESMKKRYRSESAADIASSWPLYHRLDLLLRGNTPTPLPAQSPPAPPAMFSSPNLLPETLPLVPPPLVEQPAAPPPLLVAQNSHGSNGSNGVHRILKEDGGGTKPPENSDKTGGNILETDSSTPALYSDKQKLRSKQLKTKKTKRKRRPSVPEEVDQIACRFRWLTEVVVRSEQARMETIRDIERMRAEAEAKRSELELKRTEIIANTQIEIAKIFAAAGKGVDSALRIGRS